MKPSSSPLADAARRRLLLGGGALLAAGFGLSGCRPGGGSGAGATEPTLSFDDPLPAEIPPGTRLVIGDPTTKRVLQHTGWDKELPFEVEWANISGGPGVTEAFRARALDVGSAANIPPLHAIWVGIPVKIIAWRHKREPLRYPTYVIGLSPKAGIESLSELRGRKIAFSPGQAQGAVVLRTLHHVGLKPADVTLVELPSTAGVYTSALASGLVDAAPLGKASIDTKRYLDAYGRDGARILGHGDFRDDAGVLYARNETLQDPGKAAALREYVRLWGRAAEWTEQNRKDWIQIYYVQSQGVNPADAGYILDNTGPTIVPEDWNEAIAIQQDTIDFMSGLIGRERFDAHTLYDRRYERLGHEGALAYRAGQGEAAPAAASSTSSADTPDRASSTPT